MDAVMDLNIDLEDIEVDYIAYQPDPSTGAGWTFDVKRVSYQLCLPKKPPIEIGEWLWHVYDEDIIDHLTYIHEEGIA